MKFVSALSRKIKSFPVSPEYTAALVLLMTTIITPSIPSGIRRYVTVYRGVVLTLLCLWSLYKVPIKRFILAAAPVFLYALAAPVCTLLNHRATSVKLQSCITAMLVGAIYVVVAKFLSKYTVADALKIICIVLVVYLIPTDLTVLLIKSEVGTRFFIGTKFTVSYTHWMLCSFLLYTESGKFSLKQYITAAIVFAESAAIIIITDCSTGLVGLVLIALLGAVFHVKKLRFLLSPRFVPVYMLLCVIVFVFLDDIMNMPLVQKFVTGVLGESTNLTGRMNIYKNLMKLVKQKPFFGFGVENTAAKQLGKYGNVQNGMAQKLINYGIFGTVGFIIQLIWSCVVADHKDHKLAPFGIMLIALTAASIIEISINSYFYLMLSITYGAWLNKSLYKEA